MRYDNIYAAILGTSDYSAWSVEHSGATYCDLEGVEASIDLLRDEFELLGAQVTHCIKETTRECIEAVIWDLRRLIEATDDGTQNAVVIYLAGHGRLLNDFEGVFTGDEHGFFVAAPGQVVEHGRQGLDEIDLQRFRFEFPGILQNAHHLLFILDCCHAGAAVTRSMGATPGKQFNKEMIKDALRHPAAQIMCATAAHQKAFVDPDGTDFVKALLERLRFHNRTITASRLASEIRAQTGYWRQIAEIHSVSDRKRGDFVFGINMTPASIKAPAAPKGSNGRISGVPLCPPHLHPRQDVVDQICIRLWESMLIDDDSQHGPIALYGMGGVGKSVIAAELARERRIRKVFCDGIFWIPVGEDPNVLTLQYRYAAQLGAEPSFTSEIEGLAYLRHLVGDRKCLTILDDVWDVAHVQAMFVDCPNSRMLVTTRSKGIAATLEGRAIAVDVLSVEESLSLLEGWTGHAMDVSPVVHDVIENCSRLPLALALCGAAHRDGVDWRSIRNALRDSDFHFLEAAGVSHSQESALRSLSVGFDFLRGDSEDAALRYLELAVYPADETIPEKSIMTLWAVHGLEPHESRRLLTMLERKSLLFTTGTSPERQVSFHDLQHDFIVAKYQDEIGSLKQLHTDLIRAYWKTCHDWATGPDDNYYFEHLVHHLDGAGNHEELRDLLTDGRWLNSKLRNTNVASILSDFLYAEDEQSMLVRDALRLSAHFLSKDPAHLPGQLHGRLLALDADLAELTIDAGANTWLRCVQPSLSGPGGVLLMTLNGYSDSLVAVALTPNGEKAVSASVDGTVRVWDMASGMELHYIEGSGTTVTGLVAIGPTLAASSNTSGDIYVWDLESGTCRWRLTGHSQTVTDMAVVPDGTALVSVSGDYTLKVWSMTIGDCLHTLSGHSSSIDSVVIVGDGKRAITASEDMTLRVWDIRAGLCQSVLRGHSEWVNTVEASSDGRIAVSTSNDKTLRVWDLEQGRQLHKIESVAVDALTISPDGRIAVGGMGNGFVKVWDLAKGVELHDLEGHTDSVTTVAITADGKKAISGSEDRSLRLWDLENGEMLRHLEGHAGFVTGVAMTQDDRRAVSCSWDGTLKVWNLDGSDEYRSARHDERVTTISLSANGANAISCSWDGTFKWWDLETCSEVFERQNSFESVTSVAISNQRQLAIVASTDGEVKVWCLVTGNEKLKLAGHHQEVNAVAISEDDTRAVTASKDGSLIVWDLKKGLKLSVLRGHSASVGHVNLTRSGLVISASEDGTTRVWDFQRATELHILQGNTCGVTSLAVTPDETKILTGGSDNTINAWDISTGEKLYSVKDHADSITSLEISQNQEWFASASWDQTIKSWDLNTGKMLQDFAGHSGCVNDIAIAADSRTLVSASEDATIKVWDASSGALVAPFGADYPMLSCDVSKLTGHIVAGDLSGRVHFLCLSSKQS